MRPAKLRFIVFYLAIYFIVNKGNLFTLITSFTTFILILPFVNLRKNIVVTDDSTDQEAKEQIG